tara:strand:- start:485 stop:1549 length:1065 start_codon:yes stop_codon:yes gene_type:complete
MAAATELTRQGDLTAAMQTIQKALALDAIDKPGTHDAPIDTTGDTEPPYTIDQKLHEKPGQDAESYITAKDTESAIIRKTFGTGVQERPYRLFIPARPEAEPIPLIVMLHGCTQSTDDFANGTMMDEIAQKHGLAVLYPGQSRRTSSNLCWNWFKHNHQGRGHGEPALLAKLTSDICLQHGFDESRVFVAGLSAGGAMAAILGKAYPDIFSGVAIHSGLASGVAHDLPSALQAMNNGAPSVSTRSSDPMPRTIVFHGDSDRIVNPVNGDQIARQCTDAMRSMPIRETESGQTNGRQWTVTRARNSMREIAMEHWVITGLGHAWSGGNSAGSYSDEKGPCASELIVKFFLEGCAK